MRGLKTIWLPLTLIVIAALGLGVALGFALDEEPADDGDSPRTGVSDLITDPAAYVGERVALSGRVSEVFGPHSFSLTGVAISDAEPVLVVSREPVARNGDDPDRPLLEGDTVSLSGEVDRFDLAALEQRLGIELRPELDLFLGDDPSERAGEPVVITDSVLVTPRLFPIKSAGSPAEIAGNPDAFYGTVTSVRGAVTAATDQAVVLDDQLLVLIAAAAAPRPDIGDRVSVLGAVRRFDLDQFRRGQEADLDDEFFGDFADEPTLVAESIEPARGG